MDFQPPLIMKGVMRVVISMMMAVSFSRVMTAVYGEIFQPYMSSVLGRMGTVRNIDFKETTQVYALSSSNDKEFFVYRERKFFLRHK